LTTPTAEEIREMKILALGPLTFKEIGALYHRGCGSVRAYVYSNPNRKLLRDMHAKKPVVKRPRKCCIYCGSVSIYASRKAKTYTCSVCKQVFSKSSVKTKMY
jgi:hypothetical protein